MGIELDVLVGHPEHDLLFVATQVARAAGLKNPSSTIGAFHNNKIGFKLQVSDLGPLQENCRDTRNVPSNTWLFDESRVYASAVGHKDARQLGTLEIPKTLMSLIQENHIKVAKSRYRQRIGQQLKEILSGFETEQWPVFPIVGANRQGLRKDVVILKESEVYDFLIHSRAPQTLPFRKWVTEEVLPAIRKTGQYNAAESSDPIAVGAL